MSGASFPGDRQSRFPATHPQTLCPRGGTLEGRTADFLLACTRPAVLACWTQAAVL